MPKPHVLLAMITVFLVAGSLPEPCSASKCKEKCGEMDMIYPFYLKDHTKLTDGKPDCGLSGYELECDKNLTTLINLGASPAYEVLDLRAENIRINPIISDSCSENLLSFQLANTPFKLSPHNLLQLYNCNGTCQDCGVPRSDLASSFQCPNLQRVCCESLDISYFYNSSPYDFTGGYQSLQNYYTHYQCSSFTSVVYASTNATLSFNADFGLRLEWFIKGNCSCSPNALCNQASGGGYTCKCKQQYTGDGYADGIGCLPFRKKGSKLIFYVAFGVGALISVAAVCMWLLWRYNRTKRRQAKDAEEGWDGVQPRAELFSLQELEVATQHFHLHNKLGEGGFGPVYKGTLSNGKDIAIKRLSPRSQQGKKEFLNEVNLITSVQHKNLIKLIGSCVTRGERMLVYEYLPNKSLDVVLFVSEGATLDWPIRYDIVLGVARGLAYLHEESQVRIIHRDIKPSNILLDDQLNPIISDFGLARLVQEEESSIYTKIAGTLGYLAPEYAIHGELTEKVDIYSFGVLTLEVISGKRNSNARLLEWAWRLFLQQQHLELVDPKLSGVFSAEKARRMIQVALLCTQEVPRLRPTMSRVVSWLSEDFDISEVPTKPPFVELCESTAFANLSSGSSSRFLRQQEPVLHASNAAQSISELEPR